MYDAGYFSLGFYPAGDLLGSGTCKGSNYVDTNGN